MLREFEVRHPIDLPTDAPRIAIAGLVTLRVETAAMPGDMVDFDGPSRFWITGIRVDDGSVAKVNRKLLDEGCNRSFPQGVHDPQFESRPGRTLPIGTLRHDPVDSR